MNEKKSEPRDPQVILGALRSRLEGAQRLIPESYNLQQALLLVDELNRSLMVRQMEASLAVLKGGF